MCKVIFLLTFIILKAVIKCVEIFLGMISICPLSICLKLSVAHSVIFYQTLKYFLEVFEAHEKTLVRTLMKNTIVVILGVGSVSEINNLDLDWTINDPLEVGQCGAVKTVLAAEGIIRVHLLGLGDLMSWIDFLSYVFNL